MLDLKSSLNLEPIHKNMHSVYRMFTKNTLYKYIYIYKDLFTHKDINTYINGVVKICLNKFFLKIQVSKRKEEKYAKLCTNRKH